MAVTAMAEPNLFLLGNKSDLVPGQMSSPQIRDVFLKRQRFWRDNNKILPIERGLGSPERLAFNKFVLGRNELELTEYWIQQRQLSGTAPPVRIEDVDTLLDVIENTEGAISYVFGEPPPMDKLIERRNLFYLPIMER